MSQIDFPGYKRLASKLFILDAPRDDISFEVSSIPLRLFQSLSVFFFKSIYLFDVAKY